MSQAMTDPQIPERRLSEAELRRRQKSKNLFMAGFLVVLVAIFFALTVVRMGGQMGIHQ